MARSYDGTSLDWPAAEEGDTGEVYARYAEVYDAFFGDIRSDAGFYLKRAAELLSPGDEVLEIGSGTGRVAEHLLREGYRVTGVDASDAMLKRATTRLAPYGDRYRSLHADVRTMTLPQRFPLAVAPYGMVAHLLADADRLATFRRVYDKLAPGGLFVFDDMPGWLAAARGSPIADGTALDVRTTTTIPETQTTIRLMSNAFDVADKPYTVRYDVIDWLTDGRVARRKVIRVVFRNIALADELALLAEAGFTDVRLYGGFDGRPFDANDLSKNERVVISCRRPAAPP
jgi:SAM-dependent methyltransferase